MDIKTTDRLVRGGGEWQSHSSIWIHIAPLQVSWATCYVIATVGFASLAMTVGGTAANRSIAMALVGRRVGLLVISEA